MLRRVAITAAVLVGLLATAPSATADPLRPKGPVEAGYRVTRVVDGDTIQVERAGSALTVRLIGINAPESVKPNSPVECFGPQASAFAKSALTGRPVRLEFDPSQGRYDQYGRVRPAWKSYLRAAEADARRAHAGLWGACS